MGMLINPYNFGVPFLNLYSNNLDGVESATGANIYDFTSGDAYTLMSWIKTTGTGAFQTAIGLWGSGVGNSRQMTLQNNRGILYDGTSNQIVNRTSANTTNWEFIAQTYSKASGKLSNLTNGVLDGQVTGLTSDVTFNGALVFCIGDLNNAGVQTLTGRVYHPAILNIEASPAQLLSVVASPYADLRTLIPAANVISAYHFPTGQAGFPTWVDYVSGNNLTMQLQENTDINVDIP